MNPKAPKKRDPKPSAKSGEIEERASKYLMVELYFKSIPEAVAIYFKPTDTGEEVWATYEDGSSKRID